MNERLLIALLTAINFTQMCDFVVMMPLGPQLTKTFAIEPSQFAVAVSAYTFSSAVAAVLGAFLIDRFERKRALLAVYVGFILATIACALAPDFPVLVLARCAAGAFGGLLGALVMAIVADVVPYERRGAAMGVVMSAFALASVVGVPFGVWIAGWMGWHATFFAIAAVATATLVAVALTMRRLTGHLVAGRRPAQAVVAVLRAPSAWLAFAFTAALVCAGFLVIPFIAIYLARNLGVSDAQLGFVYLCGGALALVTSPLIGRLADRYGKHRVFTFMACVAMGPTLALTHLPPLALPAILVVTTAFIVCGSGRFVPAMALISAAVPPPLRGTFMSLNSATQSAASGVAVMLAGVVIGQTGAQAPLQNYGTLGWMSCAAALLAMVLVRRMQHAPGGSAAPTVAPAPALVAEA